MSCCGIFCNPQEGSESQGKVCSNLSTPGEVSSACNVPILCSVQKCLLQLCTADEPSRKRCCPCRNDSATVGQMLSHLRLIRLHVGLIARTHRQPHKHGRKGNGQQERHNGHCPPGRLDAPANLSEEKSVSSRYFRCGFRFASWYNSMGIFRCSS